MSASDRDLRLESIIGTVAIVAFVCGLLYIEHRWGGMARAAESGSRFEDAEIIEASLAYKKVEPKTRQPQKRKKQKFKPHTMEVSRDPNAPPKEPEEEKEDVLPDEVDVESILEKNRKQDEELSSFGSDEEIPREGGEENGSELGTSAVSKGHPYLQLLDAHIKNNWTLPALERGKGTAVACVRLDESGKIVEKEFKTKSQNANIDRSVELALKESTGLDKPVPEELKVQLIEKGACFEFSP
jgi:type IV secretory pathway VirB10-like protein